jgi:hypothetical protein
MEKEGGRRLFWYIKKRGRKGFYIYVVYLHN